jgi:glycosyltransferase involved in cell wall biosynthesis
MLINVPLESLDERYSKQWNKWIPAAFAEEGFNDENDNFLNIYPPDAQYAEKITSGQFLDIVGTNVFKSAQLNQIMISFANSAIRSGDIFFFHDLWFPGIEMLFYIRDLTGIKFKICGMLHAGTYDSWDLLAQNNLTRWASAMETSWLNEVDAVFVSCDFHKHLVCKERKVNPARVVITGLPWYYKQEGSDGELFAMKEKIVLFPHRLAPEKQPERFDQIAVQLSDSMPGWQFLRTHDLKLNKTDYYALLRRASISVSFAKQETWGIAMLESVLHGCLPVVPNRLAYIDLFHGHYRYSERDYHDFNAVVRDMILDFASRQSEWLHNSSFQDMRRQFDEMGRAAIPNMVRHMHQSGWL